MAEILLVDDPGGMRDVVVELLRRAGHGVSPIGNAGMAVRLLEQQPIDLVLAELMMPALDGVEVILTLGRWAQRPRLIALTGEDPSVRGQAALHVAYWSADAVILRPFTTASFLEQVQQVLAPGPSLPPPISGRDLPVVA